jgi:hypothetical protein
LVKLKGEQSATPVVVVGSYFVLVEKRIKNYPHQLTCIAQFTNPRAVSMVQENLKRLSHATYFAMVLRHLQRILPLPLFFSA